MIKAQTCRFCMHSSLRNQKDKQYVNNYCPLDLFSGNAGRVRQAVDSLWDAWCHSDGGVNNLKVFARGRVVKPGQVSVDKVLIARQTLIKIVRSNVFRMRRSPSHSHLNRFRKCLKVHYAIPFYNHQFSLSYRGCREPWMPWTSRDCRSSGGRPRSNRTSQITHLTLSNRSRTSVTLPSVFLQHIFQSQSPIYLTG